MKQIWVVLAIIAFLCSVVMIGLGVDKVVNYYNSENFSSLIKNAYVGGDAYNYIINASYATGYYVLALLSAVCGFGFLVMGFLNQLVENIQKIKTESPERKTEDFSDLPSL